MTELQQNERRLISFPISIIFALDLAKIKSSSNCSFLRRFLETLFELQPLEISLISFLSNYLNIPLPYQTLEAISIANVLAHTSP